MQMTLSKNKMSFGYVLISILGRFLRLPGRYRVLHWLSSLLKDCNNVDLKCNGKYNIRVPSLKDGVGFALLIDAEYEPETLATMRMKLSEGDVFIDVGANVGSFALPGSEMVGPQGVVLAIEASEKIFKYLRQNITANAVTNVCIINCAAAASSGVAKFFDAPTEQFGMGSLAPWAGDENAGYAVESSTLEDILDQRSIEWERVKFIKIDVEGFELDVLKGAERFLTSCSPCILFEFIDWAETRGGYEPGATQAYLMSLGYTLYKQMDYLKHGKPQVAPIVTGAEMIVAVKV